MITLTLSQKKALIAIGGIVTLTFTHSCNFLFGPIHVKQKYDKFTGKMVTSLKLGTESCAVGNSDCYYHNIRFSHSDGDQMAKVDFVLETTTTQVPKGCRSMAWSLNGRPWPVHGVHCNIKFNNEGFEERLRAFFHLSDLRLIYGARSVSWRVCKIEGSLSKRSINGIKDFVNKIERLHSRQHPAQAVIDR